MLHAFDRLLARRALAFTVLAFALAIGVTIATDEPFSTFRTRVARLCAFAPALSAIGSAITLAQSRARGELLALEALGVTPFRIARGPMITSWTFGLLAAAVLVSPLADPSSLFPVLSTPARWVVDAGALLDPTTGVRVLKDGTLRLGTPRTGSDAAFAPRGFFALLVVVPLSVFVPAWTSAKLGFFARLAGALLTVSSVIVLLHAAAASRVQPAWLMLGSLPLVLQALFAHVREFSHTRSRGSRA